MNGDETVTSKILSNVDIIGAIYSIIKSAALEATNNDQVKREKNNVCVIKPYQPGITRTAGCKDTREYSIEYNANDLMIVGGAALNIYDYALKGLKERREIGTLEAYLKKMTSDIDIVWWPRPSTDTEIITLKSEAIVIVLSTFTNILRNKLNEQTLKLLKTIREKITGFMNIPMLRIDVSAFQTFKAGVYNINITFIIGTKILKICDIIIHDSGASQRFDSDGNEITDLRYMIDDPMYCTPVPGQSNSINYINVNGIDIAVPNIVSFVHQQMFAFDNLMRMKQPKSMINFKRVLFINNLLKGFKLNNNENKKNYKELLEVFGTNNSNYPTIIIEEINNRVDNSILKLSSDIKEVCSTIVNDRVSSDVCQRRDALIAQIEEYRDKELDRLNQLFNISLKEAKLLKDKSQFQQIYTSYIKLLEQLRKRHEYLISLEPTDVLLYKEKYNSNPDEDLQELERIKELYRNTVNTLPKPPSLPPPTRSSPLLPSPPPLPVSNIFYGYAPDYGTPSYPLRQYYFEPDTGRQMRWMPPTPSMPRGYWYYIQPPMPPSMPPMSGKKLKSNTRKQIFIEKEKQKQRQRIKTMKNNKNT